VGPSELIAFLKKHDLAPKKGLSQNFLIDGNIIQKILQTADVREGDVVLEIGPGTGALTAALLERKAHVIAIEKDLSLAKLLPRLQTEDQRLTVHATDALEFPLKDLHFDKVIANLPYHITTPLLERFFECSFKTLTLMVQKEFSDRIFAKSCTKAFGSLTLFTQFYTTLLSRFTVSKHCFYPKPTIDSSVIHLEKRDSPCSPDAFFPIVRRSFQNRRKMLSTSLQEFASLTQIQTALKASHIREDARPEMLELEQWLIFLKNLELCIVQTDEPTRRNRQTTRKTRLS